MPMKEKCLILSLLEKNFSQKLPDRLLHITEKIITCLCMPTLASVENGQVSMIAFDGHA